MHVRMLFAYNKGTNVPVFERVSDMLRELQRYLDAGHLVDVIYLDRYGQTSKRTLRLRAIEGNRVKAFCLSRSAPRVFAIENILAIYPAAQKKGAA